MGSLLPPSIKKLNRRFGVTSVERVFPEDDTVLLLKFAGREVSMEFLAGIYEDNPLVEYAQPNYLLSVEL